MARAKKKELNMIISKVPHCEFDSSLIVIMHSLELLFLTLCEIASML
jgi:hypothetical protein